MKSFKNKFLSIALTLIMVFGVFAGLNFGKISSLVDATTTVTCETIADVLATNENFPTAETMAWKSDNGHTVYLNGSNLTFSDGLSDGPFLTNTNVSADGGNYKYVGSGGHVTITFVMTDNVLSSVVYDCDMNDTYDGTYVAPHIHGAGAEAVAFASWNGGNGHNSMPTEAGSYVLTSDITLSETWTVPAGADNDNVKVVNLCLNGHIIKYSNDQTDSNVITVPKFAELNLYDCDNETKHYFEKIFGLWTLTDDQNTPTEYVTFGGCITGGIAENGAGVLISGGTFNMFGGNIVGNCATDDGNDATNDGNGGGISNSSGGTLNIAGGKIVGNFATKGAGVYVSYESINIFTGGIITDNFATENGSGVYAKEELCFAAGTLITMEDGSKKPIEELEIGESVRVFDHEIGDISSAKLFDVGKYPEKHSDVVTLHFSNEIDVTVVYGHSFFEREQNKYVSVTKDNVKSYVGHEFYNADDARWETLTGYDFVDGEVDTYVITSEYHLNCIANGMLTNEDGFYTLITNIFEYGDGLKIDADKKAKDIKEFGYWGYENLKYVTKETYDKLNFQYLSVAFGKNMITKDEFYYLESYWTGYVPELFCETEEEPLVGSAPMLTMLGVSPVSAPTTPGIYVGGSIKIINNDSDDFYLSSGKVLTIGTGTAEGGNGVALPTSEMSIGLTLANTNGVGQFTLNGTATADIKNNFFTNNADLRIVFNQAGTDDDSSDDYLELVTFESLCVAKIDCGDCNGTGYGESDCHECYGFGCEYCDYTRKAKCSNCKGKGKITFLTLKEATDAVKNNGTIKLIGDVDEEVIEISKMIIFSIDNADGFENDAVITAGTGYKLYTSEDADITTYTIKKVITFDNNFKWNNGEAIVADGDYSEVAPKIYNGEIEVTGLTPTYKYYELNDDGETWSELGSKPTCANKNYKVLISFENDSYVGEKEYLFAINKKAENIEIRDKNGEVVTEPKVLIVAAENGIDPEAVFVVEVVEMEQVEDVEESKQALEENEKISNNEKIYGIYDAKLLVNNVEVQPDGKITIKMKVPDELLEKEFRLCHIHSIEDVNDINYSNVDNEGFITFETEKLSQFAFVAEKPVENVNKTCFVHWILIALFVSFIAAYLLISYYTKGKFWLLIATIVFAIATIVLTFFADCLVCYIFSTINIVIVLYAILLIFLNNERPIWINKNNDK